MNSLPRLALFASGNGSNLQQILEDVKLQKIPATVALVISDKKDAYALERAKKAGVDVKVLSPKNYESRTKYDEALRDFLKSQNVDWVILAGFMRILGPSFVGAFSGRILNIHPALLPKYPGMDSIRRAFDAKEKEVGVTVHFVDEGVDTGPIVAQEKLSVLPGESLEELTGRVHELEHRLYPKAIADVVSGKKKV